MIDPVLIILAAPYSRASLVCAMLGQHPDMYALPDINLFLADDVEGVLGAHAGLGQGVGDGLLRLIAQLHDGEQTDDSINTAEVWLQSHADWTTRQLLDYVYEKLQPRFLVDSSPTTAMNEGNLERMRRAYPDANFLHLVSHPRYVSQAFAENRASGDALPGFLEANEDGESVWYRPNNLLSEFAVSLPAGQCMRLMVEDLIDDPENYLLQIAQWLDVSTDGDSISAMLHPEKIPFATRGPARAPGGMDAEFLAHPGIPETPGPTSLAGTGLPSGQAFSQPLLKLGKEIGYR